MRLDTLTMEFGHNGKTIVSIWVKCHTVEDIDQMIDWLGLARSTSEQWQEIYDRSIRTKPAKDDKLSESD